MKNVITQTALEIDGKHYPVYVEGLVFGDSEPKAYARRVYPVGDAARGDISPLLSLGEHQQLEADLIREYEAMKLTNNQGEQNR